MHKNYLHIDIETYSSVPVKDSGHYKYAESLDFEILLIGYAINEGPVKVIDLASGEEIPDEFYKFYYDEHCDKYAHNAAFERTCLDYYFDTVSPENWYCTQVLAGYAGLPLPLKGATMALRLDKEGKAKSQSGDALIRYFSIPCKPTKKNGQRHRNLPHHAPEKWAQFVEYCRQDVVAERAIHLRLKRIKQPELERKMYVLDQRINDLGIKIDVPLAKSAVRMDRESSNILFSEMRELTNLENPNSASQLKKWLGSKLDKNITSVDKEHVEELLSTVDDATIRRVLKLRLASSKTSVKKFIKMLSCASDDDSRARGLFQFNGANRTGRWAGRLIQLQNLKRNKIKDLDIARRVLSQGDFDIMSMLYDDPADILSQLIRTALIARDGHTFNVADFSAIEARVLSWLADELWRLEVFRTHGMIYEASAAKMFGLPLEKCTKKADEKNGTSYRDKGKVAELALGYQGSVGALKTMGGEKMGLTEIEMKTIVNKWRGTNSSITKFWTTVNKSAMIALRQRRAVRGPKRLIFNYERDWLTIKLPSGRKLYYYKPQFGKNKFDRTCITYMGVDGYTKKWTRLKTYGGKLTENIVQAIARDLLAFSMINLDNEGFNICMHVHDEAACEVPISNAENELKRMCDIMAIVPNWAVGLPLGADGYTTPYYKKD